ncbi:methylmalonyl-CoA mutase family protein [Pseudonocardia sp. H11422]|uniref:methylmalonyl-CoA mutase family protein n=1 Tax=Pseudonocardia sp. H11422 TaxID=2835866 RepID=UPI001BDC81F8|nr:methylmalonyl-CoA mutase family protein [Pseudonocardia sp. H11422]
MSTPQVDTDALDRGAPEEPDELVLAGEFPVVTAEEWSTLVDGVARKAGRIAQDAAAGAGVEKLTWSTPDAIRVRPLYTAEDTQAEPGVPGRAPFVRGSRAAGYVPEGWDVRQRHADPDPETAKTAIMADLENGVTSVWLGAGPNGTAIADLPAVLADVYLDLAPLVLDAGPAAEEAAEAFLALAAERKIPAADLVGNLGLDPIGLRARTGESPGVDSVVALAQRVAAGFTKLRAIVADALPVHEAGGSDAQELGWSMAAGLAYLRVLTTAGLRVDEAARLLEFRYAATGEQFATIAKLRAARRLWSRVTEVCGAAAPQQQHAVSSSVMQSRRDPWVNLLRGTVAGFAAGAGGADAVTVAPFDAAIGLSEPFSRRIARNTQALLISESHLARVIDPAGGSWYVEHLTDDLAQAAWAFFQEIEAAGGAVAALDAGLIAERTAEVRAAREKAVANRRVPLTGVSEFPNLDEKLVERRPRPERVQNGGLPVFRLAEPFEVYRDRSDAQLESAGARPTAFLATLGSLAAYTARAGFARNLLQAGGIEAPEAGPTESPEDVATAFAEAGTPVAVLCSTDAVYAERAEATVAALREAGARTVLLAGKPSDPPIPGVDGYLYAGCDALAVIEDVYEALEVAK